MLSKYNESRVPHTQVDAEVLGFLNAKFSTFKENMDQYGLSFGLDTVWEMISYLNNYIQVKTPWKLVNEKDKLSVVLNTLVEGIAYVTTLLQPFMPFTTAFVLDKFGVSDRYIDKFNGKLIKNETIEMFDPIFPRLLKDTITVNESTEEKEEEPVNVLKVKYEDFAKLDLRVAKVIEAKRVKNSDKLIELTVSLGNETRTIVAGIGKFYSEEELLNKKIVIITNLEERKLMGITSQGMLLAASTPEKDKLSILTVDKDIEEGAHIS